MKIKLLAPLLGVFLILAGCANQNLTIRNNELNVLGGDLYIYQCENGERINAKYYSLSDSSLAFVKLALPCCPEITLARAISASGERYSNESLEWWIKGDRAFVQTRNQDGEWQFMYRNCQVITEIK